MDFLDSLLELSSEGSFGVVEVLMIIALFAIPAALYFLWRHRSR